MDSSSKRRKRSSSTTSSTSRHTDGAAAASTSTLPSLCNFSLLPVELRVRIARFACRLSSSSSSALDISPATCSTATPGLDAATALSLVPVSRSLYAVVTPLIWSHVWITTGSALASFHQAIAARPQLGRLVVNLHMGPDTRLPKWWWPLGEHDAEEIESADAAPGEDERGMLTTISHSLRSPVEMELLPEWYGKEDERIIVDVPTDDCRDVAIHHALNALQQSLDIDLRAPKWGTSGKSMIIGEWTTRLFEVQAGLELYLMAMRRTDDERQRDSSGAERSCGRHPDVCLSYPPLVLNGTSSASAPGDHLRPVSFSRHQLLRHIARRGSITDRLDHPLLFERSGFEFIGRLGDYGSGRWEHFGGEDEEQEDSADLWSPPYARAAAKPISPASIHVLDPALPNTATLGSLLTLARAVLSSTPLLRNLSLTGFLDRSVCGFKTISLKALRHLTIGPPPPAWVAPLRFASVAHLHTLRICGVELCDDEAIDISCELRSLTHFQWSLAIEWSREPTDRLDYLNLDEIVDILRGTEESLSSSERGADSPSPAMKLQTLEENSVASDESAEDDQPTSLGRRSDKTSLPLYEIKLHPTDLQSLLDKAPSAEAGAAWLEGGTVANGNDRCRLLLVESAAAAKGKWKGVSCTADKELYKEGKEWWERCAGLK